MPEHVLMSEIEIITDGGCRRRWNAAETLRIVEKTRDEKAGISVVARRNGVAPNLLYRWRRLMCERGSVHAAPYPAFAGRAGRPSCHPARPVPASWAARHCTTPWRPAWQ